MSKLFGPFNTLRPVWLVDDSPDDIDLATRAMKRCNYPHELLVDTQSDDALARLQGFDGPTSPPSCFSTSGFPAPPGSSS